MRLIDKLEDETILVKYFLDLVDYIDEDDFSTTFTLDIGKLKHLARLCHRSILYDSIPPIIYEIQKIIRASSSTDEIVSTLWKFLHISLNKISSVGYCYALIVQVIPAIHLYVHKQQSLDTTKVLMAQLFTEGKYD